MGADNIEELKTIACPKCGGGLSKGSRTEYDEDDEEDVSIPVAQCIQCGAEYDQHTSEYYAIFADDLTSDKDATIFRLGLKGTLKGINYEIIGRLRYQEEEEYEKCTWDEWVAISEDGMFHYFVEEDGRIDSYEDYIPESIDMESDDSYIEFEGKKIKKSEGYTGRIVLAEGELPWKPEIGEPALCYDFKKDGDHFTIEKSDEEVSITRGARITHGEIIEAFSIDSFKELYANTIKKRASLKKSGLLYLAGMIAALVMAVHSCSSNVPVQGVTGTRKVLTTNSPIQDSEGNAYMSQVLYGPFEIPEGNRLYDVTVKVDESVQNFNLEWQSFRFMLIGENRLSEMTGGKPDDAALLKEIFDDVDAMPEPLESFVIIGDFWDEEGRDSDGYWHESDTSHSTDFVLDEAGRYYVYMELYNNQKRDPEAVTFSIAGSKGYRYYIIAFVIFFLLWGVSRLRAGSYNELPFEMSDR